MWPYRANTSQSICSSPFEHKNCLTNESHTLVALSWLTTPNCAPQGLFDCSTFCFSLWGGGSHKRDHLQLCQGDHSADPAGGQRRDGVTEPRNSPGWAPGTLNLRTHLGVQVLWEHVGITWRIALTKQIYLLLLHLLSWLCQCAFVVCDLKRVMLITLEHQDTQTPNVTDTLEFHSDYTSFWCLNVYQWGAIQGISLF